jgi:hypothetical protein
MTRSHFAHIQERILSAILSSIGIVADSQTVLWDQILLDPWSNVFHDPDVTALDFEDRDLDPATIDFISGVSSSTLA